jgi:tRNA 2-thiouridine synthesizing protein A
MTRKKKIDKILDVQGLSCPMPTVITSKTLKQMKKGSSLQVVTNDSTTKESIPTLCSQEGYRISELREQGGLLYFTILK